MGTQPGVERRRGGAAAGRRAVPLGPPRSLSAHERGVWWETARRLRGMGLFTPAAAARLGRYVRRLVRWHVLTDGGAVPGPPAARRLDRMLRADEHALGLEA